MQKNTISHLHKLALGSILLWAVLVTGAGKYIGQLRLDYDFERFFPENNPDLQAYRRFQAHFPPQEGEPLMIVLRPEAALFDSSFFAKIQVLAKRLRAMPEVKSLVNPLELYYLIESSTGLQRLPYMHWQSPKRYAADSALIFRLPHLAGSLWGADGRSVALLVHTQKGLSNPQGYAWFQQVEALVADTFTEVYYVGKYKGQAAFIARMGTEMQYFAWLSLLLAAGCLYFFFRNIPLVVLTLATVGLGVFCSLGLIAALGIPLNLLSVLSPAILMVVGISMAIHLLEKYMALAQQGQIEALRQAWLQSGRASLLTALTTAVGFWSLRWIEILPVQDFGSSTALGVLLSFLLTYSLLPALLLLLPFPQNMRPQVMKQLWGLWLLRHRKVFLSACLLLLLVAMAGVAKLQKDHYLLGDWKEQETHKQAYNYVAQHYEGYRPFELLLHLRKPTALFDKAAWQELAAIEKAVQTLYPARQVYSSLSLLRQLRQAKQGVPEAFALPHSEQEWDLLLQEMEKIQKKPFLKQYIAADERLFRMSSRLPDLGTQAMQVLHQNFDKAMQSLRYFDYERTGTSHLIDQQHQLLLTHMAKGLLLNLALIALIVLAMFRSWRMLLVACLVNLLPLAVMTGLMGWWGIPLNMATCVIFPIAFGIAVDDTIHFLSAFQLNQKHFRYQVYALRHTLRHTGKAMVISSFVLSGGFVLFAASSLASISYIGLLVSATLLTALLSDLLLLPMLILLTSKDTSHETLPKNA